MINNNPVPIGFNQQIDPALHYLTIAEYTRDGILGPQPLGAKFPLHKFQEHANSPKHPLWFQVDVQSMGFNYSFRYFKGVFA